MCFQLSWGDWTARFVGNYCRVVREEPACNQGKASSIIQESNPKKFSWL